MLSLFAFSFSSMSPGSFPFTSTLFVIFIVTFLFVPFPLPATAGGLDCTLAVCFCTSAAFCAALCAANRFSVCAAV